LAPDHPLVDEVATPEAKASVRAFVERMANTPRSERTAEAATKEGVFTGGYASHPFTGEAVPIWVANFVVADYGTGAVMAVPGHDGRDYAFARAYGLPVRQVVQPVGGKPLGPVEAWTEPFTDDGVLLDSGPYSGLPSAEARRRLTAELERRALGVPKVTYRQK